jgi:hypothetical protein
MGTCPTRSLNPVTILARNAPSPLGELFQHAQKGRKVRAAGEHDERALHLPPIKRTVVLARNARA